MASNPLQTSLLRRVETTAEDAADGDFVQVAMDVPVYTTFTYRVPEEHRAAVQPGVRLLVPFRGKPRTGIALHRCGPPEDEALLDKIVDVADVLDVDPVLTADQVELIEWAARYYVSPIGEAVRLAIPAGLRVAGERTLELADGGRRALTAGIPLAPLHRALLERLEAARGPANTDDIKAQLRGLTYAAIAQCEKAGWIVSAYIAGKDKIKKRMETYVALRRDPYVDERLGPAQEAIIGILQTETMGFEWPLTELRDLVNAPLNVLRRLEARGMLHLEEREIIRDPFMGEPPRKPEALDLTPDQAAAVGEIRARIDEGRFHTFLLHGVTGSGKTEVYIRTIQSALELGRNALVLLPEISLTPQFVAIFRGHFGDQVAVLHSALTPGERYDQWRLIHQGKVRIVIGARSALFAPLRDVGVIIVDEEHDHSFKQENGCRYHARDLAQVWGQRTQAVVLLGSATPSVDTYHNARQQRIGYLPMSTRVGERQLPEVEIVDMRDAANTGGAQTDAEDTLSVPLQAALQQTLAQGEQAILFLNRRGWSPFVMCRDCGVAWRCPNCAVSLTYHQRPRALRCHYCDHTIPMPQTCFQCQSEDIGLIGTGTEKLEQHLQALYPEARVARLDRDTGRRLHDVIRRFRNHEIDLLLGTQMVTKGHDFPNVTLVGVIMADLGLNLPDFRAGERTFQILTQVAGRAGRGEKAGRVLIQTWSPWHYAIEAAREHSYQQFVTHELHARREMLYPPFASLASLIFEAEDPGAVERAARGYAAIGKRLFAQDASWVDHVSLLGPAQAPLAKLRGKTRWQILLKGRQRAPLRAFLTQLLQGAGHFDPKAAFPGVNIIVDVDPQSMM